MPFTDEMLKEIKNGMSTLRMTMDVTEYSMSAEWLEALLARLDASEACAKLLENDLGSPELDPVAHAVVKDWLKSAGRGRVMREIKFRAWDTNRKRMIWGPTVDSEPNASWVLAMASTAPDRIVVMQFTGLKDKNGKDIFEGDIVSVNEMAISETDAQKRIRGADVVFSDYRGTIEWDEEGADYNITFPNGDFLGFPRHKQEVEVIGNIYEHPSLLTPEAPTK